MYIYISVYVYIYIYIYIYIVAFILLSKHIGHEMPIKSLTSQTPRDNVVSLYKANTGTYINYYMCTRGFVKGCG